MVQKIPVFAAALLMAAASAYAAPIELSFQSVYSDSQTQTVEILKPWADSFAERTNGDFVINHFAAGSIVEASETGHSVKSGMLDISVVSFNVFSKESPYSLLTDLPFLAENARHGTLVYDQFLVDIPEIKAEHDDIGVELTIWSTALYGISSVKSPIRAPSDMAGKRIIVVIPNDSVFVDAWGGIPVFVPPTDAYIGLQRGMGEALLAPIPFQRGLRIMEVAHYITPVSCKSSSMSIIINRELFEGDLTQEQRDLLVTSTKDLGMRLAENLDKDVDNILAMFAEHGAEIVELTSEETARFKAGAESLLDSYWRKSLVDNGVKGNVDQWITRIYEMSASVPVPE